MKDKEAGNCQVIRKVRDELLSQVRAELDFKKRRLPKILVEMGEPYGINNIEFADAGRNDWSPPAHSYICKITKMSPNEWQLIWAFAPEETPEALLDDEMKAEGLDET